MTTFRALVALCFGLAFRPVSAAPNQFPPRITCLFETGRSTLPLDTIENLRDGRGKTLGWAGFTTADEEVVECVEEYTRRVRRNHLAPMLPLLRRLRDNGDDDTRALDQLSFDRHWRNACSNPAFVSSYALVVDRKFGAPARAICARKRFKGRAIAYAILFDALVQNGGGSDPDGVPAMIERTPRASTERAWLALFLDVRRRTLQNPRNKATRAVWRQSVSRISALKFLLDHNPQLAAPVRVVSSELDAVLR